MIECFEIHDSTLRELTQDGDHLTIRLKVIRIDWPTAAMDTDAEVFTQEIELDFESASILRDGGALPINLLDGSFKADHHDGIWNDENDYLFPATIRNAQGVRMVIAGTDEANQDYITMEIQARSMKLTPLGEPEFLQRLRR